MFTNHAVQRSMCVAKKNGGAEDAAQWQCLPNIQDILGPNQAKLKHTYIHKHRLRILSRFTMS